MKILPLIFAMTYADLSAQQIWDEVTADYEKLLSPAVYQYGYDTQAEDLVRVSTEVYYIYGFNEQLNYFMLSLSYRLQWVDSRLDYSSISSQEYIKIPAHMVDSIWAPRISIENTMKIDQEYDPDFVLYRNGTGEFTKTLSHSLACHYNFEAIPFDSQKCKVEFLDFTPPGHSNVRFELDGVYVDKEIEVHQWEIHKIYMENKTRQSLNQDYEGFDLIISIKRRITYTFYFLLFPGLMIILLSYSSFWIDYRASPSRTTLASVTILASITQLYSIFETYPRIGYNNWLLRFLYTNVCFTVVAMIEYVIVNRLWIIEEGKLNTARYIKKLRKADQGNENESIGYLEDEVVPINTDENVTGKARKCFKELLRSPPALLDNSFRFGYLIVYFSVMLEFLLDF